MIYIFSLHEFCFIFFTHNSNSKLLSSQTTKSGIPEKTMAETETVILIPFCRKLYQFIVLTLYKCPPTQYLMYVLATPLCQTYLKHYGIHQNHKSASTLSEIIAIYCVGLQVANIWTTTHLPFKYYTLI